MQSGQQANSIPQSIQEALNFCQAGRFPEAESILRQVLANEPHNPYALHFLGLIAHQSGKSELAVELIGKALTSWPAYTEALGNLGNVLQELRRFDEAFASYEKAISIQPELTPALLWNCGLALKELRRYEELLALCDKATAIDPGSAEALFIRGNALQELKRFEDAVASYDKALAITPEFAEALRNRGNALLELERTAEALASFDRALSISPGLAEALYNRASALQKLRRFDEAIASYDRALAINADVSYMAGARLHMKLQVGDWNHLQQMSDELAREIEIGARVAQPFPVLAVTGSPRLQRRAAEIWVNDRSPPDLSLPPLAKRPGRSRIRIGYYSADFREHAVARLIAGVFEQHDRSRFELFAFGFGPGSGDAMRERIHAAFDRFFDVRGRSDRDVALLSREHEVDIAMDLTGLTGDNRIGIFSHRAAPLQVNYLGYPGTTGAEYFDYLVADRTLITEQCRQYISERIAYLPNSYQANDRKRAIAPVTFSRSDLGLPEAGFVFCCFNESYKLSPAVFDRWMRILRCVEGSVLWLLESSSTATRNLRREAAARGVDSARLIFAKRMPQAEHLARHRAADLFIDTLPYNAHTTASDALWAGLPVLTCAGEAFASRVAASLLNAVGLPELIATTPEQYEALAVELATNQDRLARTRQKLEANRLTTPLFDTQLCARHLEAAYTQMYERHQAGLPPEDVYISQT